jgi:tetratricopeptide (TPR) repeat protein
MEVLGRDRLVPLHGSRYERGAHQFESNLEALVRAFRRRGTPVLVASVPSNLRDQRPFASDANSKPGGAVSVFEAARLAFSTGDSVSAERLFARARDLDVVRFRAPGEFDAIVRRITAATGAIYIPVAEAFAAASPAKTPGANLFLEHVHPTREGQALIGRVFFQTMLDRNLLGRSVDTTGLRAPDEYLRGMSLTPFDERVALHTVRTLTSRWPFVPESQQSDYRARYVPSGLLDSVAFAVSRGARWEIAKLRLAADYERRRQFDSAAAEYAGLVRDAPLVAEPLRLMARALTSANRQQEAEAALRKAVAIQPAAADFAALGAHAARRRDIAGTITLLRQSLALEPRQPRVLYQLSLAYGISRDLPNARAAALRLREIDPQFPGLSGLLKSLGIVE